MKRTFWKTFTATAIALLLLVSCESETSVTTTRNGEKELSRLAASIAALDEQLADYEKALTALKNDTAAHTGALSTTLMRLKQSNYELKQRLSRLGADDILVEEQRLPLGIKITLIAAIAIIGILLYKLQKAKLEEQPDDQIKSGL